MSALVLEGGNSLFIIHHWRSSVPALPFPEKFAQRTIGQKANMSDISHRRETVAMNSGTMCISRMPQSPQCKLSHPNEEFLKP